MWDNSREWRLNTGSSARTLAKWAAIRVENSWWQTNGEVYDNDTLNEISERKNREHVNYSYLKI